MNNIFPFPFSLFNSRTVPALCCFAVLAAVMPQGIFADEHGGGQTSLNPLEWASNTAFWSLVIFVTVFALLGKFAFRPIAAALDAREQGIADRIAAAQRLNEEAKDLMKQYQDKLDASRDEVRQIMETAKKDAQRVADDIGEKAQVAASQERDRAAKEIESATASALQTIAERSASLATNLAGRMIRAEVKPEQHRDLINAALQDFVKS
ncbi:MAG: F0F1 ATP synthase subunit B [Planctomycetaceae bacterium]|jgi:F-type H+-transporting ATPase subunit b|nr:F0F1 ATP synthase subunit B [Planctomycetaceae bacterium]